MEAEIKYKDVPFTIEFDFTPGEAGDNDYPGTEPEIDIQEISFMGVSFYDILENDIEDIEEEIVKYLKFNDEYY